MKLTTLTDRLTLAVTTEKQDAIANGTDGTPRVTQRLQAMVDAIGIVAEVEALADRLITRKYELPKRRTISDWIDDLKRGGRP